MTLGEMKERVLTLIEEYNPSATALTDDVDIAAKLNLVINMIQNELARFKKIPAMEEMEVAKGEEMELTELDNFFQLNIIRGVDADVIGNTVYFNSDGTAKIHYYRYPKQITSSTDDTFKFNLSNDVLEIMPYGIAADVLKSDVSSNYGAVYANRYTELKQTLDSRYSLPSVYIEGGFNG